MAVGVAEDDRAVGPLAGIVDRDLPVTFVNSTVVVPTEQDGIGNVGRAASVPWDDVMRIGVGGRPLTAWESAATVAKRQQAPL